MTIVQAGDPLSAYEATEDALEAGDDSPALKKAAVLALARGGATSLALERFEAFGLDALSADEDALALRGRLLKDKAHALSGDERRAALAESAAAYGRAFELTGGFYSGINAASLAMLTGETARSHALARDIVRLLEDTAAHAPQAGEQAYWRRATKAEALVLLGDEAGARAALAEAIRAAPDNHTARAATLRQLGRLAAGMGFEPAWLDDFRPPAVAFFAGRMGGLEAGGAAARELKTDLAAALAADPLSAGYGALAAGGDILFAEALLDAGGRLHAVLPCDPERFEAASVTPWGADWRDRFWACLAAADTVTEATNDATLLGEVAVELAARLAMGAAILQARALATRPVLYLAAPRETGMSGAYRALWRRSGKGFEERTAPAPPSLESAPEPPSPAPLAKSDTRTLSAMVFADLAGFGALSDAEALDAIAAWLEPLAERLRQEGEGLLHLNSWGDGVFAAYAEVGPAARAALAMRDAAETLRRDLAGSRIGALALRAGAHYGPVTVLRDPVTGRQGLYGSQVSLAARVEPLAVPGSILVTEAFASALALEGVCGIRASYVGRRSLRGFNRQERLFALSRDGDN